MDLQQYRHVCGRCSEEPNVHAISSPCLFGPFHFVFVIDERAQNKSDVTVDKFFVRNTDVMAGLFKNGRQISSMNARHVMKELPNAFNPTRCPINSSEPRSVASYNRILIYKTTASF